MNITYSLILCATIKECADNYTLEQWASRVDFNASAITKMLLPISPLCAVEVLRARAQENRRIPGVRALPFGFGFRRSAIVSRVKGGARAPLHSALTSCHGCFVICDHKLLFTAASVQETWQTFNCRKNFRGHVFCNGWYLKHRLTHSLDDDKELVIAPCAYYMLCLLYRNISFMALEINFEKKYSYIFYL